MLVARALTKHYRSNKALESLDLEIAAGEVFCLLGPNGAGKTTALSLFLGFIAPTSGAAHVGEIQVDRDPWRARAQIAYVPEQVRLYPHLSGLENLTYFLRLSNAPLPPKEQLERVLIEAGVPPAAVHRRADGYSKGMCQKVVLALAQARSARALLLDEPTSGLDPSAAGELYHAIQRESARGAAVLMVTHDLTAVTSVAHRFGIMRAGQLVHVSSAAGLVESDVHRLYREHLSPPAPAARSAHHAPAADLTPESLAKR